MKNTRILLLSGLALMALATVYRCNNKPKPTPTPPATAITPVQLPTNLVPGFRFPEDSSKVYSWLQPNYDSVSIINHAWGIWAGLTAKSGQQYKGQDLLVFETWLGTSDIQVLIQNGDTKGGCEGMKKSMRTPLEKPHQFGHAARLARMKGMGTGIDINPGFLVTVAYDPNAACFATQNLIFKTSVLQGYMKPGKIGSIPAFPNNAITTKPTYYVGKKTDGLIRIPVWLGPASPAKQDILMGDTAVYADVNNRQPANKQLVPVQTASPTPEQIAAATCNLSDFIYFTLDSLSAAYVNRQQGQGAVQAGDVAILVAMHVATKEISNWTWQTFWWTPDPAAPPFPSSAVAGGLRPKQLQGAASHYAVATAYTMVLPNQPLTGGTNKGVKPVLGYNPYLEPGLSPFTMADQLNPAWKYGQQTNCMSCHSMAYYDAKLTAPYTADQYISRADTIFLNKVQLDFAWSILGNLVPPPSAQ